MTIIISKDMKTATLTDDCVLYTEDGEWFTQVDSSTGYVLSKTKPGSFLEAFLSVATWGPLPAGARWEHEAGTAAKKSGVEKVRGWKRRYEDSTAAHVIGWVVVILAPFLLLGWAFAWGYAVGSR